MSSSCCTATTTSTSGSDEIDYSTLVEDHEIEIVFEAENDDDEYIYDCVVDSDVDDDIISGDDDDVDNFGRP